MPDLGVMQLDHFENLSKECLDVAYQKQIMHEGGYGLEGFGVNLRCVCCGAGGFETLQCLPRSIWGLHLGDPNCEDSKLPLGFVVVCLFYFLLLLFCFHFGLRKGVDHTVNICYNSKLATSGNVSTSNLPRGLGISKK